MGTKKFVGALVYPVLLIVGFNSLCQAELVQWKIEDGGNGHWYEPMLVGEYISWTQAKIAAENMYEGGYLATITSAEENAFVFSLISDVSFWSQVGIAYVGPWIGGYQPPGSVEPSGGWSWVTGEPWSYSNWDPESPNDSGLLGSGENDLQYYALFAGPQPTWNDCKDEAYIDSPVSYIIEISEPPTLPVSIDIKPGSDPSSINLRKKGVTPVAILTTNIADGEPQDFDAATVDPGTVLWDEDGCDVAPVKWEIYDVPEVYTEVAPGVWAWVGDGDLDLLLYFDTQELVGCGLAEGDVTATIEGETFGGQLITGTGDISIVKGEKS